MVWCGMRWDVWYARYAQCSPVCIAPIALFVSYGVVSVRREAWTVVGACGIRHEVLGARWVVARWE